MTKLKTSEKWKKIIDAQRKSGLSVAGYAKQNNIKPSTLQYWSKKIKNAELNKIIKLEVKPLITSKPTLLIINNIKLETPAEISSMKLSKIISVIREDT